MTTAAAAAAAAKRPRRRRFVPALALAFACAGAAPGFVWSASAPAPATVASAGAGSQLVTPLALAGPGPYYTLSLPMALQAAATRFDLDDLRVRNAAGETMPLAWVPRRTATEQSQRVAATLYKVPAPAPAASAVANAASSAVALDRGQAWIVDTRDADSDLVRLDVALEPGTQGVYTLKIEASDDLQRWRTVQEEAQLVQLQQLPIVGATPAPATTGDNGRLIATGIDLDRVPARYLRLTAAPRATAPPLVSATITRTTHRRAAPAPLEWSAPVAPASCDSTHCDYPLPHNVAVDALQIDLADANTIGQVTVLGQVDARPESRHRHPLLRGSLHALRQKSARPAAAGPALSWDVLAIDNVYWLPQASGAHDLHSPPIRLDGERWPALRLQTRGPLTQLGHVPPVLRLGARPRALVFLARGSGPFTLERVASIDETPALPRAQLMPGRGLDDPLPGDTATPVLAAIALPAPPSAPTAGAASERSNAPWLWAALLAGLALMGAMAWTLLRRPAAASASATKDDAP
jgi:hypothetical protein